MVHEVININIPVTTHLLCAFYSSTEVDIMSPTLYIHIPCSIYLLWLVVVVFILSRHTTRKLPVPEYVDQYSIHNS